MDKTQRKITLVRHGKPQAHDDYSSFSIVSGENIEQYIRAWNTCKLHSANDIPSSLNEIFQDGELFISSELIRTHESFHMLGISGFKSNHLFNEADLPYGIGKSIKMPFVIWMITLRLLWRFGLSCNSESYKNFTMRVSDGADFLEKNKNVKHTILMAHGFVNRVLKKELLRRNWKILSSNGGHRYWSHTTFEKV